MLRRLDASAGSGDTLYIVIGAAVGVVALLVVAAGVVLCRRERRRARALADMEQYVHVAPAPPASQLSPGISAAKGGERPPGSAAAAAAAFALASPSERYYAVVTSPVGASAPAAGSAPAPAARRTLLEPAGVGGEDDAQALGLSQSQRSRSNSFEKHESYRRFMYGSAAADPSPSAFAAHPSPPGAARRSALWDDPAIVAARIPLDQLELGPVLSRGGFGEVLAGAYRSQRVAVKRLLPETRRDLRHIEGFLAEIRLHAALEHPRVVRFVGVAWAAPSDLCVVSEFAAGGDLRARLERWPGGGREGLDAAKTRVALDVAHALVYLHSLAPAVLHRDLKSRNVLLDAHGRAQLTDFGVARERADATMTAGVGTSLWMAPEVMMGDRYGTAADVFSFGVLLSELDTLQLPYARAKVTDSGRSIPDAALLQLVACGELRASFSRADSPAARRVRGLGERCVSLAPADRPTAADALYQLQLALREFGAAEHEQ